MSIATLFQVDRRWFCCWFNWCGKLDVLTAAESLLVFALALYWAERMQSTNRWIMATSLRTNHIRAAWMNATSVLISSHWVQPAIYEGGNTFTTCWCLPTDEFHCFIRCSSRPQRPSSCTTIGNRGRPPKCLSMPKITGGNHLLVGTVISNIHWHGCISTLPSKRLINGFPFDLK